MNDAGTSEAKEEALEADIARGLELVYHARRAAEWAQAQTNRLR